jgi:hypothetical protein
MENVQCKLPALPSLDAEQAIHGQRPEFMDKEWFLNGTVMPPGQEFLVLGIKKVVQRWEDGKPVEAIVEHPDRELPDVEALNQAIPKSEWDITPDGKPRPPWSLSYAVYLLRLQDAQIFTSINSTQGQRAAAKSLSDSIRWMCALKQKMVWPVVTLGSQLFSKRFKNYRPDFVIVPGGWRELSGDGFVEVKQLTASDVGQKVEKPTLAEEMSDAIEF